LYFGKVMISCLSVEQVSRYFSILNINDSSSAAVAYSMADRIQINRLIDAYCGSADDSAWRIRHLVAEYLGYPFFTTSQAQRFTLFREECNSLIQRSNQEKPANTAACVILQAAHDPKEMFNSLAFLPQLKLLATTHFIVFQLIGLQGETLGGTIRKIARDLNNRPIKSLIVRAHGDADTIAFNRNSIYSASNVKAEDFDLLDPLCSIIFDACSTGQNLAKKVAEVCHSRSVFAARDDNIGASFIPCCSDHGYGMITFDTSRNLISRRYQLLNASVIELLPCSATHKKIEELKKAKFEHEIEAAEAGDPVAQSRVAEAYDKGVLVAQSDKNAFIWYQKAAIQELASAQYNMSIAYKYGLGVSQSPEKAFMWCEKAALKSYMKAEYDIGQYYEKGFGVAQSYEKAYGWYLRAAQQSDGVAESNIGYLYYKGFGVSRSDKHATEWWQLGAVHGSASAQYNLGVAYHSGIGVIKSIDLSLFWLRKAAEQGDKIAQEYIEIVEKEIHDGNRS
jgi:hypothetical protein